jgi:hypothetical protein
MGVPTIVLDRQFSGWQQRVGDTTGGESGEGIVECGRGPCCRAGKA